MIVKWMDYWLRDLIEWWIVMKVIRRIMNNIELEVLNGMGEIKFRWMLKYIVTTPITIIIMIIIFRIFPIIWPI